MPMWQREGTAEAEQMRGEWPVPPSPLPADWHRQQQPIPDSVLQLLHSLDTQPPSSAPTPSRHVEVNVKHEWVDPRWGFCPACRRWVRNKPILGTLHFCGG